MSRDGLIPYTPQPPVVVNHPFICPWCLEPSTKAWCSECDRPAVRKQVKK